MKERRCLKFTGYIYMPDKNDDLRDYAVRLGMGRVHFYDDSGNKKNERAKAFDNLGMMTNFIAKEYKSRSLKRLPKKKGRK